MDALHADRTIVISDKQPVRRQVLKAGAPCSSPSPVRSGSSYVSFRERIGLTQEELAERAGLSAQGISALERGLRRRPYLPTVRALAEALDLTTQERATLAGAATRTETAPPDAAAKSAGWQTGNLPAPLNALIGREQEIAAVRSLLRRDDVRLAHADRPRRGRQDPPRASGRRHCRAGPRRRGVLRLARGSTRPRPGPVGDRGRARGAAKPRGPLDDRAARRAPALARAPAGARQLRACPGRGARRRRPAGALPAR